LSPQPKAFLYLSKRLLVSLSERWERERDEEGGEIRGGGVREGAEPEVALMELIDQLGGRVVDFRTADGATGEDLRERERGKKEDSPSDGNEDRGAERDGKIVPAPEEQERDACEARVMLQGLGGEDLREGLVSRGRKREGGGGQTWKVSQQPKV
jgi:hypothetical protein